MVRKGGQVEGEMECEIAGDPELIGSVEDSAGNRRDSNSEV